MKTIVERLADVVLAGPRWVEIQVTTDSVQNAREAARESSVRRELYDEVRKGSPGSDSSLSA